MEFTRKEEAAVEAAVAPDQEVVQLDEMQLIAVGGGIADVTFS